MQPDYYLIPMVCHPKETWQRKFYIQLSESSNSVHQALFIQNNFFQTTHNKQQDSDFFLWWKMASLPKTYKAAAWLKANEPLEIIEIELKLPKPGEVLVKVLAVGMKLRQVTPAYLTALRCLSLGLRGSGRVIWELFPYHSRSRGHWRCRCHW